MGYEQRRRRARKGNVWLVLFTYDDGSIHAEAYMTKKEAEENFKDGPDWGTATKLLKINDLKWPEKLLE